MEREYSTLKTLIVAGLTAISTFLGWYGWIFIVWIFSMLVDWITGSIAAWKSGDWSSKLSREGILHKGGCIIVVLAALMIDVLIWSISDIMPEISIHYQMYLSAVVMLWYIVTEIGSIIENAGKLGAPVPQFLIKGVKVLKFRITKIGKNALGDKQNDESEEHESSSDDSEPKPKDTQ